MEIGKKDMMINSLDNIIREKEKFLKNRYLQLKGGNTLTKDAYMSDFSKELIEKKDVKKCIDNISNYLEGIIKMHDLLDANVI